MRYQIISILNATKEAVQILEAEINTQADLGFTITAIGNVKGRNGDDYHLCYMEKEDD